MSWTNNELEEIASADELRVQTGGSDGALRKPVTIWVVRVGNEVFVRAINGPTGKWFRHATEQHRGRIEAGGVVKDVTFVEPGPGAAAAIDAAYQNKYERYGDRIVGTTLTPQAKAATLKTEPAD